MSDKNILNMEDDIIVFNCNQEQIHDLIDIIIARTSEDELKLILLDLMGRFDCYFNNSHLLIQPINEIEEQRVLFEWLNRTIRERLELIAMENLRNLEQYNRKHTDSKLPYYLIIVHEVADLHLSDNIEIQRALLNDDNAGVYFIVASKADKSELKMGSDLNMFRSIEYDDLISLMSSKGTTTNEE